VLKGFERQLYGRRNDFQRMTIIVEDHVGGREISYDLVKLHRVLSETLVKKGILTGQEIEALDKKSE
jgi:hypothetical protein